MQNYRKRLTKRGLARFEVLGLAKDRELIRTVARRLADNDSEAAEMRSAMHRKVVGKAPKKGGIVAALRRSPLIGAELDIVRPRVEGRKVYL